jgi:hypothetical protein
MHHLGEAVPCIVVQTSDQNTATTHNLISKLIAALSDPRVALPVAGLLLVVTFLLRAWR